MTDAVVNHENAPMTPEQAERVAKMVDEDRAAAKSGNTIRRCRFHDRNLEKAYRQAKGRAHWSPRP